MDKWLSRLESLTDEEQQARWDEKRLTSVKLPEYVRYQLKLYEIKQDDSKLNFSRLTLWAYKEALGIYVRPEDLGPTRPKSSAPVATPGETV